MQIYGSLHFCFHNYTSQFPNEVKKHSWGFLQKAILLSKSKFIHKAHLKKGLYTKIITK